MYIYIYRERERERKRKRDNTNTVRIVTLVLKHLTGPASPAGGAGVDRDQREHTGSFRGYGRRPSSSSKFSIRIFRAQTCQFDIFELILQKEGGAVFS